MKIELFQPLYIHEIGTRDNQEDALWPKNPTIDDRLFVLCDGMGGHEHGEVASQTVTQALGKWFAEHVDVAAPINDDQIRDAIEYAYTQLDKYADGSPRQMGTTLTLIYFGKSGVTAAHMGDSRIYHIRPSEGLLYVSRDHSLVFDLYQSGEITYDEMKNFKQKNIVTRAMTPGEDHRMRPDIIHVTDVKAEDYFFSCSDGMLEQMTDNELFEIFASDITDEDKKQLLIKATIDSKDNHTAWIIPIKGVIAEEGDKLLENEEPTARCNALNITPPPPLASDDNDVQIADDDDVALVSSPKKAKRELPILKFAIATIAIILLLFAAWFLFLRPDGEIKAPQTKSASSQNSITKKSADESKDSTNKEIKADESAKN
jgi:protein phosphatase